MCVAVRAATVIVPMRSVLMAVLFVSILLMRMIVPVLSVLMVVLFVGILLMGMIMPMRLIVLVRVASMGIIMIGHVLTSDRCVPVRCSTAKSTLGAFDQHLAWVDSIYYWYGSCSRHSCLSEGTAILRTGLPLRFCKGK